MYIYTHTSVMYTHDHSRTHTHMYVCGYIYIHIHQTNICMCMHVCRLLQSGVKQQSSHSAPGTEIGSNLAYADVGLKDRDVGSRFFLLTDIPNDGIWGKTIIMF